VRIRNLVGEGGPDHGEWVLLGTHYDTRPRADRDEENPDLPVPGANDGASGVAVLLEIAHVVNPQSLRQPVRLVFFDAEDSGGIEGWDWIVGSNYYANQLEDYPSAVIVVDMVGDADLQLYYEQNSDPVLGQEIWEIAAQENFPAFVAHPKYSIIDDHIPFRRLGIPAVDVIDFDYPYWHTADDTLDKLSPESLAQVGHTLQRWLENRNE
jgi:Zn-dependent M28 family amino/carboxypeptidase